MRESDNLDYRSPLENPSKNNWKRVIKHLCQILKTDLNTWPGSLLFITIRRKTQQEVADEIGITRSTVSRLITEAQEKGIVEHIVHYPWRTSPALEKALITTFQSERCHCFITSK